MLLFYNNYLLYNVTRDSFSFVLHVHNQQKLQYTVESTVSAFTETTRLLFLVQRQNGTYGM